MAVYKKTRRVKARGKTSSKKRSNRSKRVKLHMRGGLWPWEKPSTPTFGAGSGICSGNDVCQGGRCHSIGGATGGLC